MFVPHDKMAWMEMGSLARAQHVLDIRIVM